MLINELMQLSETKKLLNEKFVDIEVKMVLQKIIDDGKITDGAQTAILVTLLELLKTGKIATISNLNDGPSGSADIVKYLKELDDKKVVKIAEKMLEIMNYKDAHNDGVFDIYASTGTGDMEMNDWIKYLLSAQA